MSSAIKNRIVKGSLWALVGQLSSLFIILVTNILMARILGPTVFGRIGIIMFFISVANILVEGGLSGALIRKLDVSRYDYATVFTFNFIVSVVCFLILIFFSNKISNFYNDSDLKYPLILSSSILIINAFQIIPNTRLISELKYKEKSLLDIFSVILSSSLGLYLAYHDYGIWSLVIMQVSKVFFYTFFLCFFNGLFLDFSFKKKSFGQLYKFGVNTSLASFISVGFDNIYQLILGKYFSLVHVGYFYQAKRLQDVPTNLLNMLCQGVFFSTLAKYQENNRQFESIYNSIFSLVISVLGFITIFTYCLSYEIIVFLFGLKWIGAVVFLKMLCMASFFFILENLNRIIFKVFNKTKQLLLLEVIKKLFQTASIILGVYYVNIYLLLIGFIISNAIGYFINYTLSKKILRAKSLTEGVSLLKILFLVIFSIVVFDLVKNQLNFRSYDLYIVLVLIFCLYLLMLNWLKIISTKKHIKYILSL